MSAIVVLGANGMLGSTLVRFLSGRSYRVVGVTRRDFDPLADPLSRLESIIGALDPIIINCLVHQNRHSPSSDALLINSLFPHQLSEWCGDRKAPLIHISTNAVFPRGQSDSSEMDAPAPSDFYGISKLLGEPAGAMVLRTSIIGLERCSHRYFLEWIISQAGGSINGFINHRWNGLTTLALAEIIENIVSQNRYRPGVHHVHSADVVSKYELSCLINKIWDLRIKVTPEESDLEDLRTLRSAWSSLSDLNSKALPDQLRTLKRFIAAT